MTLTRDIRAELLNIIGAVGAIREHATAFERVDVRYFESELDRLQATAHRLLEFIESIEQESN